MNQKSIEKRHLYANNCHMLNENNGFYLQLTLGRELSNIWHDHDFYEIICVLSGSCMHLINNTEWKFNTGNMVLIRPGIYHRLYAQEKNTNVMALSVRAETLHTFLDVFNIENEFPLICLNIDILQQINQFCSQILTKEKTEYNRQVRLLLGQLLIYFSKSRTEAENAIPEHFRLILSKMQNLNTVAKGLPAFLQLSNFSYSQLNRLTKRYLNMTPGEYITSLRLQFAYDLIVHENLSYDTICDMVGFSSFSHFCKLIRQRYGMSPAKLRRSEIEQVCTV